MAEKIRVLLADDHAMMREGLATLVNAQPDMEVVDEASDGRSVIQKSLVVKPDVVVLDISMPKLSGVTAATEILRQQPRVRVLVLSMHEDRGYLREMLEAGVAGYVVKRSAANELITAVRVVMSGTVYIDPTMAGKIVSGFIDRSNGKSPTAQLSEREEEVLRLIAHGYSNKEIAAQLFLSVKTVETYKARSMEKTGMNSRVDIIRFARDRGWLDEI